jgi:hypothetical protein
VIGVQSVDELIVGSEGVEHGWDEGVEVGGFDVPNAICHDLNVEIENRQITRRAIFFCETCRGIKYAFEGRKPVDGIYCSERRSWGMRPYAATPLLCIRNASPHCRVRLNEDGEIVKQNAYNALGDSWPRTAALLFMKPLVKTARPVSRVAIRSHVDRLTKPALKSPNPLAPPPYTGKLSALLNLRTPSVFLSSAKIEANLLAFRICGPLK